MRASRGIRLAAWSLVAAAAAAPPLRRRLKLPPAVVLGVGAAGPFALVVAVPRSRARDIGLCALNMWAYIAAYEMPADDLGALTPRVRVRYPVRVDTLLGLGTPPTLRLQRFARPGRLNRFERTLVWCHWMWFMVPHGTLAFILLRDDERFAGSAARMYAVFDLGAMFYWAVPTAPPWWAAAQGELEDPQGLIKVRRMMIEYGELFWGERWKDLYDVLGGNPVAAMPSLHFATSVMAAHLLSELGPLSAAVGWSYAALLGLALVYLGEHYLVDLLAGAALTESVRAGFPALRPLVRALSRRVQAPEAAAVAG